MSASTLASVLESFKIHHLLPKTLFDGIIEEAEYIPEQDDESFYVPLYPDIEDFNYRHDTATTQPIYLNDFDFNIEEDREKIATLLRTEYEGNSFDTVASCTCKKYRSNAYLGTKFTCDECGDPVTKPLTGKIETKVWIRPPANVSGFINPTIMEVFLRKLNTKTPKVNLVEYWINKDFRNEKRFRDPTHPAFKIACKLEAFRLSLNINFGYNEFVDNMDLIIRSAIEHDTNGVLDLNERNRAHYAQFWEKFKGRAIALHLPIPNKITSVVESDQRDRYVNKEKSDLEKLFYTIADMYPAYDYRSIENPEVMGKIYVRLKTMLLDVTESILFKKKGMIRYHAGAGKLPMTGRSIITGESGVCRSDTIIVPWLYGITCLDKHLTNWLYRKGYTPLKVKEIIRSAATYRHPLVEEFYDWVETNRYAIVTCGRQPSIQYLSARGFFVNFNRDVEDKSIRIPITTVREFNADFDGDQMYLYFILDMIGKVNAYSNWGHMQMCDPNKPFKTSRFVAMTKTNLLNINSVLLATPIEED